MPDEDKNFGGSLVLDFRKRWRHVKTISNWYLIYTFGKVKLDVLHGDYKIPIFEKQNFFLVSSID